MIVGVVDVYINGYGVVLLEIAAFVLILLLFWVAYQTGAHDTKRNLSLNAAAPPPDRAHRFKTLPTPDGLDAELMTFIKPGQRTELRLVCCKVKDCGTVLLTPHEYSPEAKTENQYATEQGWNKARVPPDEIAYWYCPDHMKAVRELLTLEEA